MFDKSGRLLDGDELKAFKKSKKAADAKVKAAIEASKPEDPTSQNLKDNAKVKAESDAMDVKAEISTFKGDDIKPSKDAAK